MGKKILLSPVGGTDPIKYFHDGSMLHICRYYVPDVIYLYISHEMLLFHQMDNRYTDAIERLGKLLGHSFEVHIIEKDEWINVQKYDEFYAEFREEIQKISKQMDEDDELLLNIASGTPAMKSALLILATLGEYSFKPIQVSSPNKQMNSEHEDRDSYEPEIMWELNEDNKEDAKNRCEEVRCLNLIRLLKIQTIEKHIDAYDYMAALAIANEIKDSISEDAYRMICIAASRVKLNRKEVNKLEAGKTYDIFPVKEGDKQKIFEYALVLQIKVKKQEYADFIRGITPLVVDLLENILKKEYNILIDNYCTVDKYGIRKWNMKDFNNSDVMHILNNEYKDKGGFKGGNIYSDHLIKIIQGKNKQNTEKGIQYDFTLNTHLIKISAVEQKIRNTTAHEIVSVTDEWIKKETGQSVSEIFDSIKYLIKKSGINAKEDDWKSYDRMNKKIHEFISE